MSEPEAEAGKKPRETNDLRTWHDKIMRRFDAVAMPQAEMRAQSLEARRFVTIQGAMWEGAWGEQFENSPRPEVDKITKSLEKIETDFRENRLTVDYVPDGQGDSDTADTLDGMHRADSYHFKAQQARDNAFQEGIRGGFGAYRLTTDYADPYDPSDESQRVNPGMAIVDADQSVYFDPASILYDKSDAKWAFVITAHPREDAKDKWGDGITDWSSTKLDYAFDWYAPDTVRTAEYFEVEDTSDTLIILTQQQSGEEQRYFESEIDKDELKDLKAQGWKEQRKPIKRKRVHKWLLSGSDVLRDCGYIAGPNIPIVPFYGRRDFVDGMERWRGHVTKKMDRQRIYNTRVARLVETDSLAPFEKPIFAASQMPPNLAKLWADSNIERHPYALVEPLVDPSTGQIVNAGPIGKVEPPQLPQVTAALLQIAATDLTDEDDNADQVKANTSAEAMDLAAARVDAKSGIYLDNMRQSIAREGEIYLGMAREVYFEPGRKVETLTNDGQDGEAELQETVLDEQGVFRIRNDLTRGKYKVIADVQESTATKRQKTVKQNIEIANVATEAQDIQLAQAAILTAVMNQDGEGLQDMQAFARNRLIGLGVVKPTPEEQQQIEAAQQGQQPDPTSIALQAQAKQLNSQAGLNDAKAVQTLADAALKHAQAEAVGGPESAPQAPSGLSPANDLAGVHDALAGADLKRAQAEKVREEAGRIRIRRGHEIEMERRQQDLAETQSQQQKETAGAR